MQAAHEYVGQHTEDFKNQLVEWLKIPSVSTDPAFKDDIQRAAEWLASDMRRIGLKNVAIMPTNGHPIVYGEWLEADPNAPTVLVYGHYDVQPAVMEDGWDHDPFDPIEKDGILYARGATDDKGQVMIEMKAAEAMLATGNCPVNLKYIIEGEEESSSENLPIFIAENKDLLKADICLISDTGIQSEDQPSIVYGLRGLVTMEVLVSGPKRDMHSGTGGIIHNPAQVIAEIVAKLHNEDGTITIPGFYDDVATVPDDERAELNRGDVTADRWQAWMGDLPEWGEPGYTKIERTGIRPTLEINGISGGYAGDGFKTVLPAKAKAKISCRLVPNQSAEKIYAQVRDYILQIAPDTVHVEVISHGHGEPALTDLNHPSVQAAIRAYAAYWDKAPIPVRGGGSIPIVTEFQQTLGLPVVLLGFGLPDAGAHGPNECFHLDIFRKGIDTVITYMHELVK